MASNPGMANPAMMNTMGFGMTPGMAPGMVPGMTAPGVMPGMTMPGIVKPMMMNPATSVVGATPTTGEGWPSGLRRGILNHVGSARMGSNPILGKL